MNTENLFERELAQNGYLVYRIRGYSMLPLLRQEKDLAVIRRDQTPWGKYDAVLFKRDNGQYVLHRIVKLHKGGYLIAGDNCAQREFVREDQLLGRLTAVIRDGKHIPATARGYRLYARVWCDLFWLRWIFIGCRELARKAARTLLPESVRKRLHGKAKPNQEAEV